MAVIHDFFRVISENLSEGNDFVREYNRIQPKIGDIFEAVDDQFDEQRPQKHNSITVASVFKDAMTELKVQKVAANIRNKQRSRLYLILNLRNRMGSFHPGTCWKSGAVI